MKQLKLDIDKQIVGTDIGLMGLRREKGRKMLPDLETDWTLEEKEKGEREAREDENCDRLK